jgi:hypothetical protein
MHHSQPALARIFTGAAAARMAERFGSAAIARAAHLQLLMFFGSMSKNAHWCARI